MTRSARCNDYRFRDDPAKTDDSRWVHRPRTDRDQVALRTDPKTVEGRIYGGLMHLLALRREYFGFGGTNMDVLDVGNDHIFGFVRSNQRGDEEQRILVLVNFTEQGQRLRANELRLYGLSYEFAELISGAPLVLASDELYLEPYQVLWLVDSRRK